jgi:hypothetical protein
MRLKVCLFLFENFSQKPQPHKTRSEKDHCGGLRYGFGNKCVGGTCKPEQEYREKNHNMFFHPITSNLREFLLRHDITQLPIAIAKGIPKYEN